MADGIENNLDTLADVLNANVEYRDNIPEKKPNNYDHWMKAFSSTPKNPPGTVKSLNF